MNEIWKDVVDFENIYEISSLGNFRRHSNNPRKAKYKKYINRLGYEYVSISKLGKKYNKTIHQMVCAAFIPNFKYGMHVNHKDGNKQNNCLDNLELTNHVYNNTHSHTLLTTTKRGKSIYRNVSLNLDKRSKNPKIKYIAGISINSKRHHIGCFLNEIDAAKAVDNYLDLIGDTLRIRNFP